MRSLCLMAALLYLAPAVSTAQDLGMVDLLQLARQANGGAVRVIYRDGKVTEGVLRDIENGMACVEQDLPFTDDTMTECFAHSAIYMIRKADPAAQPRKLDAFTPINVNVERGW